VSGAVIFDLRRRRHAQTVAATRPVANAIRGQWSAAVRTMGATPPVAARTGAFTRCGRMDDTDMYNYPLVNSDGTICNKVGTIPLAKAAARLKSATE